jgi:hypothetical protein
MDKSLHEEVAKIFSILQNPNVRYLIFTRIHLIHTPALYYLNIDFNILLFHSVHFELRSDLFPLDLPTKIQYAILFSL